MAPIESAPLPATPSCIQEIYPRYSARFLDAVLDDYLAPMSQYLERTGRAHYALPSSFDAAELSAAEQERIRGRKVVCMSLYFKPSSQTRMHHLPKVNATGQIPRDELERNPHTIWENTHRSDRNFFENYVNPVLHSDFRDWVPLIYLAQDLSHLAAEFRAHGWLVVQLKHSGI